MCKINEKCLKNHKNNNNNNKYIFWNKHIIFNELKLDKNVDQPWKTHTIGRVVPVRGEGGVQPGASLLHQHGRRFRAVRTSSQNAEWLNGNKTPSFHIRMRRTAFFFKKNMHTKSGI